MPNLFSCRPKIKQPMPQVTLGSKQAGVTFIEVLVSFFILATGILGAVALQASAQKGSFDAMQRSVASMYAQNIIERIRSNDSDVAILESYEGTYGVNSNLNAPARLCNSIAEICTAEQMVASDLFEFQQLLQGTDVTFGGANAGGLVQSNACIEHTNSTITVVVSWQSRESTIDSADVNEAIQVGCGANSERRRQIVFETFIF